MNYYCHLHLIQCVLMLLAHTSHIFTISTLSHLGIQETIYHLFHFILCHLAEDKWTTLHKTCLSKLFLQQRAWFMYNKNIHKVSQPPGSFIWSSLMTLLWFIHQVPNYYKVISHPMDLTNIRAKLQPQHFQHYTDLNEFASDLRLLFFNCATFNDVCTTVHTLIYFKLDESLGHSCLNFI